VPRGDQHVGIKNAVPRSNDAYVRSHLLGVEGPLEIHQFARAADDRKTFRGLGQVLVGLGPVRRGWREPTRPGAVAIPPLAEGPVHEQNLSGPDDVGRRTFQHAPSLEVPEDLPENKRAPSQRRWAFAPIPVEALLGGIVQHIKLQAAETPLGIENDPGYLRRRVHEDRQLRVRR